MNVTLPSRFDPLVCKLESMLSQMKFDNFTVLQDWVGVFLREIDFVLKICWSIPCIRPLWRVGVRTGTHLCFFLNNGAQQHRKWRPASKKWCPLPNVASAVFWQGGYLDLNIWWKQFSAFILLLSFTLRQFYKSRLAATNVPLPSTVHIPNKRPGEIMDLDFYFKSFRILVSSCQVL